MGLAILIIGLALFIGIHVVTTRRALRAALIARIGEIPYKIVYSAVALIGIVVIAKGYGIYRETGWIDLWDPPAWTRHLAALLMLPAVILVVAAYVRGDIYRKLKHPMLVGVKLWALAHLIANGDLGSVILFGAILGWAVYDRISLKHRSDSGGPPIAVGGRTNDVVAIAVGTIFYAALALVFHPLVIGVPVFATRVYGT